MSPKLGQMEKVMVLWDEVEKPDVSPVEGVAQFCQLEVVVVDDKEDPTKTWLVPRCFKMHQAREHHINAHQGHGKERVAQRMLVCPLLLPPT